LFDCRNFTCSEIFTKYYFLEVSICKSRFILENISIILKSKSNIKHELEEKDILFIMGSPILCYFYTQLGNAKTKEFYDWSLLEKLKSRKSGRFYVLLIASICLFDNSIGNQKWVPKLKHKTTRN
jgi:hypothetical protein